MSNCVKIWVKVRPALVHISVPTRDSGYFVSKNNLFGSFCEFVIDNVCPFSYTNNQQNPKQNHSAGCWLISGVGGCGGSSGCGGKQAREMDLGESLEWDSILGALRPWDALCLRQQCFLRQNWVCV